MSSPHYLETGKIPGLSPDELVKVLKSPRFSDRLFKIAWYTIFEGKEAGLAVYKGRSSDKLSVSKPLYAHATNSNIIDLGAFEAMMAEYNTLNVSSLLLTSRGTRRRDVALTFHSHPSFRSEKPHGYLFPSPQDLEGFEETMLQNPGLIDGILTPDQQLGKASLLLYRSSENPQLTRLHTIGHGLGRITASQVIDTMHEAGINTSTVEWNLRTRELLTDPTDICAELYE